MLEHYMEHYMKLAYEMCTMSPDPSTQNGAVLIPKKGDPIPGYNHIYEGIPKTYENREEKYEKIVHAEWDAILACASTENSTLGATLVCPWVACKVCAISIIGSGIGEVVYHQPRMEISSTWNDNIEEALEWLRNHGVVLSSIDEPIAGAPDIRVSGKTWSPQSLEFTVPC